LQEEREGQEERMAELHGKLNFSKNTDFEHITWLSG
jgi:hypothetical protein